MANTTEDKLRLLAKSKTDIMNAIKSKKVPINDTVPLSEYDVYIKQIRDGSVIYSPSLDALKKETGVLEGDIGLVYDPETNYFSGLYKYQRGTWLLLPTQLTASADTIAPGFIGYGINGVEEGHFTSDATATADDLLSPKIAYANGKKITGLITAKYETLDTSEYYDTLYPKQLNYTMYDMVFAQNLIIFVGKYGSSFYFHCLENNENIIASYVYPVSNFKFTNMDSCAIQVESIEEGYINLIFGVSQPGNNAVQFKKVRYSINDKSFTVCNNCYLNTGYDGLRGYWSRIIRDDSVPNLFYLACPDESIYSQFNRVAIIKITWTESSGTAVAVKSGRSYAVNNAAPFQQIGDGNYVILDTLIYKINKTDLTITLDAKKRFFVSHDLNYMFYNNSFYRITNKSSATSMYNSKVLLKALDVQASNIVFFSENDNYLVVSTTNTLNIYKIEGEDIYLFQQFSIPYTEFKVSFNSNGFIIKHPQNNQVHYIYYKINEQVATELTRLDQKYYTCYDANVQSEDVLNSKIYYGRTGKQIGTMPNNGELTIVPSAQDKIIPLGYTSGGTVKGDADLHSANIIEGIAIFGVQGTYLSKAYDVSMRNINTTLEGDILLELYSTANNKLSPRENTTNDYDINYNSFVIKTLLNNELINTQTLNISENCYIDTTITAELISSSFQESTDLVGNLSNTKTETGAPVIQASPTGENALYLNGSSFVQYNITNAISEYTLEFEFYKANTARYSRIMGCFGTQFEIEVKESSSKIYWGAEYTSTWKQNQWNKLRLQKVGNSVTLTINDKFVATRTYSGSLTSFVLGKGTGSDNTFTGYYRNLRLRKGNIVVSFTTERKEDISSEPPIYTQIDENNYINNAAVGKMYEGTGDLAGLTFFVKSIVSRDTNGNMTDVSITCINKSKETDIGASKIVLVTLLDETGNEVTSGKPVLRIPAVGNTANVSASIMDANGSISKETYDFTVTIP